MFVIKVGKKKSDHGEEGCPDKSDIVTDLAINDALNGTLCGDKISGYGRYR